MKVAVQCGVLFLVREWWGGGVDISNISRFWSTCWQLTSEWRALVLPTVASARDRSAGCNFDGETQGGEAARSAGCGGIGDAGENFWEQERADHDGSFQRLPVPVLREFLRADAEAVAGSRRLCRRRQSLSGSPRFPSADASIFRIAARWANAAAKIGQISGCRCGALGQPGFVVRGWQYGEISWQPR